MAHEKLHKIIHNGINATLKVQFVMSFYDNSINQLYFFLSFFDNIFLYVKMKVFHLQTFT
jgi:hypothetical protein